MPNQTTIIRFDGNYFSYQDINGDIVRIPAISGATNSQDSQLQNVVKSGPIPEGSYDVKQSEYEDIGVADFLLGGLRYVGVKAGGWPGSNLAWGTERVWLEPQSGTNTFGRADFSIHGGSQAGSAGCIDLVDNAPTFFNFFKSLGSDAVLQVDYGSGYNGSTNPLTHGNSNITIENIYSNQGKDLNEIKPLQNFLSASKAALEEKLQMSIPEKSVTELLNDYKIKSGNSSSKLQNNEMVKLNEETKAKIENLVTTFKTEDGNEFSLVEDFLIPLKDGTVAAVNTVLDAIDSAVETTANFLTFEAQKTAEIIIGRLKSDTYIDSLIGGVLSDVILGENDPKKIAKNLAEGQLKSLATSLLDENIRKILVESGMSQSAIDNLVGPKVANYVITKNSLGDSVVTTFDANGKVIGPTLQGTIYTAVLNFVIAAADSSGWNSEEYAQAAKVAIASAIVSAVVTTVLTAIAPGIGTVAGIVISAVVNALVVGPLVTYVDDQYKITEDVFIMARDLVKDLVTDPINTIEDFDPIDTAKQLKEYAIDYVENVGKFGRNVLIGAYNLFGGNYGKTYKPGQYPTPYSYLKIEPKEDGSGNKIIGLEPEGVVAIAREYYHDDLYGNSGSDNLIGKSGTNTIYGYGGNDHIEGRGDVDLLVGGDGDDEVFGGNGDDQLYGGNGNDNLFGGNGNDQIVGGDGNDFIQGGNGDDQIMGEGGDDVIQGNAGNDVILGGFGNDRIEGNEGDYNKVIANDNFLTEQRIQKMSKSII